MNSPGSNNFLGGPTVQFKHKQRQRAQSPPAASGRHRFKPLWFRPGPCGRMMAIALPFKFPSTEELGQSQLAR